MKKIIIIFLVGLVLFTCFYYFRHPLTTHVTIRGHVISVELAITESEKEKGLGYRDVLAPDAGMLFVYQNKDRYGFWMKGMRFPLDFIWIDGNQIVDLSQNIPAPSSDTAQPITLSPRAAVDKVLEVNAGTIGRYGIAVGDTVRISN